MRYASLEAGIADVVGAAALGMRQRCGDYQRPRRQQHGEGEGCADALECHFTYFFLPFPFFQLQARSRLYTAASILSVASGGDGLFFAVVFLAFGLCHGELRSALAESSVLDDVALHFIEGDAVTMNNLVVTLKDRTALGALALPLAINLRASPLFRWRKNMRTEVASTIGQHVAETLLQEGGEVVASGRRSWKFSILRGWIGLIEKGSGTIIGAAYLKDCLPALQRNKYHLKYRKHRVRLKPGHKT